MVPTMILIITITTKIKGVNVVYFVRKKIYFQVIKKKKYI